MTDSSVRLLALTMLFPILVVVALAVALTGCDAQLSVAKPAQKLATAGGAFGIAVDSTNVYVSTFDPSPLLTIPVGGGTASPVGVQAEGHGIAVDERRLYWSDGQSVLACDKANCTGSTVILAPGQLHVMDLVIDATTVYWATASGTPGEGRIMKADKNGGTPFDGGTSTDGGSPYGGGTFDGGGTSVDSGSAVDGGSPVQIAAASWPYHLVVDATYVYWIDQTGYNPGVMKAPTAGGPGAQPAEQLVVNDQYAPEAIALDDDNVYYANGAGMLFEVSKSGGPTKTLLSNLGQFPVGLATDATTLYIAASTKLVSMPLGGGGARTMATGIVGAEGIALDATSVYIADDPVLRVAK